MEFSFSLVICQLVNQMRARYETSPIACSVLLMSELLSSYLGVWDISVGRRLVLKTRLASPKKLPQPFRGNDHPLGAST